MGSRILKSVAAAGLSLALIFGGGAVTASAASTWYKITGYSQSECLRMQGYHHRLGAQIVSVCHYRTYDHKWAFSYYWK